MIKLQKLRPIIDDELKKMMIGSLVLNKKNDPELVTQLELEPQTKLAKINGKPKSEYYSLPVTIGLLTALGWRISHDIKTPNVVTAWPAIGDCDPTDPKSFMVKFILSDGAIEGWGRGEVIATAPYDNFWTVSSFVDLEHLYLIEYSERLEVEFASPVNLFSEVDEQLLLD